MPFLRAHKIEICIFLLALVVRLLYFGLSYSAHDGNLVAAINAGDSYYDIGQNIIADNGYSAVQEPPYVLTSYRTPGMPFFIAWVYFLFGSYLAVIILQIVLGSIVPLLGMKIARFIVEKKTISVAVGIFLALEPTGVLLSTVLLSETVFAFLFALSLICLFHYWNDKTQIPLLASAFLLGIATLTRPSVEYLPVIIVAVILWEARKRLSWTVIKHIGLYVFVFLTTLSPWLYRNYQEFGVLGLSSQQGAALYSIMVPSVLAIENGTDFSQEYNTEIAGPNETNFSQSSEYSALALPILISHPRGLALLSLNTGVSFFIYDGVYDVLHHIKLDNGMFDLLNRLKLDSGIPPGAPTFLSLLSAPFALWHFFFSLLTTPFVFVLLGRLAWLFITLAFLIGVWHIGRTKRQHIYALTAASIVAYLMLTTLVVGMTVNYRYRFPVNAIIFTFAAYGVTASAPWLLKKFRILAHKNKTL